MAAPLSPAEMRALELAMLSPNGASRIGAIVENNPGGGGAGVGGTVNTAITTVGAGTLTAAALVGGLITRSGSTAAYTDTTATAAQLAAAVPEFVAGMSWYVDIKNTVAFAETIAGGTGVTLSGQTVIPANSVGTFLITLTSASVATMQGISISPVSTPPPLVNTADTTVGAATLTAAAIAGGIITRSGSTAAYSDTTATAALIIAARPNASIGDSWLLLIKNTVPFNETILGGSGVTVSGVSIIPPNSVGMFLVTYNGAGTVTMVGIGSHSLATFPLMVNTAITTVGAGTLTAAGIVGGLITRSGSTAAYSDATDTAVNIVAAIPNASIGQAFQFRVKNTVGFNETITAGAGVTLAGQTIIPPNSVGTFLGVLTSLTAVTITGVEMSPMTTPPLEANTAITTVGDGVLTAAGIVGRLITRSGSTAAYTDTTDTAAAIIAAMPNANVGDAFEFTIKNTVAFAETLAAGTDVTLAGLTIVPPLSSGRFLVKVTAATTVTITGIDTTPLINLPPSKFTTTAAASPLTAAAGDLTGANHTVFEVTTNGAFALTTRTGTEMFGDIPNCAIGFSYLLTVISQGDNTVTITPGASVTIDTATIATKVARTYNVTFTSATACTWETVNKGTVE